MHELTPTILLEVWQRGFGQSSEQKALILLSAAFPDQTAATLAEYSIGQRNTLLMNIRDALFGSEFECVTNCPQCGERLEFPIETSAICFASFVEVNETLSLEQSGYNVTFRLPNSYDLARLRNNLNSNAVEQNLLELCLISVRNAEGNLSVDELPNDVIESIADAMERADPNANIQLVLNCPSCEHQWQSIFHLVEFIWKELDAWSRRVLQEVHSLASAYGWREHDILNMHPWRRQIYLDMINT